MLRLLSVYKLPRHARPSDCVGDEFLGSAGHRVSIFATTLHVRIESKKIARQEVDKGQIGVSMALQIPVVNDLDKKNGRCLLRSPRRMSASPSGEAAVSTTGHGLMAESTLPRRTADTRRDWSGFPRVASRLFQRLSLAGVGICQGKIVQ